MHWSRPMHSWGNRKALPNLAFTESKETLEYRHLHLELPGKTIHIICHRGSIILVECPPCSQCFHAGDRSGNPTVNDIGLLSSPVSSMPTPSSNETVTRPGSTLELKSIVQFAPWNRMGK